MFENAVDATDAACPEPLDENMVVPHRGFLEAVAVVKRREKHDSNRPSVTRLASSEMECPHFFRTIWNGAFETEPVLSAFLAGLVGCGLSGCDW